MKQIKLLKNLPNELLYGRVGYLWACLFLNKYVGEGTIPSPTMVSLTVACYVHDCSSFLIGRSVNISNMVNLV